VGTEFSIAVQVAPGEAPEILNTAGEASDAVRGVLVTVNSDDPAYFGGYVLDNYLAIADALDLTREDLVVLARNSIEASFLPTRAKAALLTELDGVST